MKLAQWTEFMMSSESADRAEAADQLPDEGALPEVVDKLVNSLKDADPLVRSCAAETLGMIDVAEVREELRNRLKFESDALVISYVISSLGEIGVLSDLDTIASYLDENNDHKIRTSAAFALCTLSIRFSMGVVAQMCVSSDKKITPRAFATLRHLTELFRRCILDAKSLAEAKSTSPSSGIEKDAIERILERKLDSAIL